MSRSESTTAPGLRRNGWRDLEGWDLSEEELNSCERAFEDELSASDSYHEDRKHEDRRSNMTLAIRTVLGVWLAVSLMAIQSNAAEHVFATVGTGRSGALIFRTVFRITNESADEQTFLTEFRGPDGGRVELPLEATWTTAGTLEETAVGWEVKLPAKASVELALGPQGEAWFGWARISSQSDIPVSSFLQMADGQLETPETHLFEDLVFREIDVISTSGSLGFAFPITFIDSTRDYNTAFALVNLSDRPAEVEFRLRPDHVKTIHLNPREVFRTFFNEFWELAFPAIFPYRFEGVSVIRSDAPLAMTVLRTLNGFPLSGVEVTSLPPEGEPLEFAVGEEIELKIGETAKVSEIGLELTFWNVVEDSRCPIGVTCIWEGRAVIQLRSRAEGEESQFQLTFQAGQADLATRILDLYRIELEAVTPIPDIAIGPIEAGDYRIKLRVKPTQE